MITLHKKLTGEVPMVYNTGGVTAGWIAAGAAAVGAGYSIYAGEKQQKLAKNTAAKQERLALAEKNKQEALIKKQELMVEKERAKQEKTASERKTRMDQQQLLSGGETGTGGSGGSLLA